MIPAPALIARLQGDLTRKASSLTNFVVNSSPYIAPGQQSMWEVLMRQAAEDVACAREVGCLIVHLHGVPQPGLFDERDADTHYLTISYHFRELLRRKREELALTEQRLVDCDGHPAAREVMLRVLELERRQIAELVEAQERCTPAPSGDDPQPEDSPPQV